MGMNRAWYWSQSYHGSFGVWAEELYREMRAGKTSIISVSASHHVSYV